MVSQYICIDEGTGDKTMKVELHFGDVKGEQYEALIKYCCATCDYFMLVYRVKRTKALRGLQKDFLNRLRKYSVKSRMDWGWAGTPCEFDERFDYRVCFYKIALGAEELLLEAEHLYGFDGEDFPQDLAFFRGNYCFLYTRTGDGCSSVVDPTKQDVAFLKERGIVHQRIDHENHEEERRRFLEHLRKAGASPELDEENLKCLEDGRLRLEESLYERLSSDDI